MSTERQSSSATSARPAIHGFDPRLVRYGSIFLLVVGTFGNLVSFVIFSYGTLRRSSTFRYLALLSLMDLLVLYSGLLDLFLMIEYGGTYSLRNVNPVTCRLHTFITYWSQHSSSWILSFISVDRAIATNCIKFARKFCTPRSASSIVGLILVLIALFNCHELIFLRLQEVDPLLSSSPVTPLQLQKRTVPAFDAICDKSPGLFLCSRTRRALNITTTTSRPRLIARQCEALKGSRYEYFWDHVWEWIDVCLYAIVPFTVMCIGTFFIVYRVYYQHRRVFRSRRSNQNNSLGAVPNRAKSLFYLLFTLNLLYFILVSPVVFVTTILFQDPTAELAYPRFKAIIYLMQYCNHSLNFIFYGITSPPYRRTLCEWFEQLFPHLPRCCQRTIDKRSKTPRLSAPPARQLQRVEKLPEQAQESISLVPRQS